ncbi:hypothetical protein DH2020_020423 [Rehmannia glutinosa]|uniref:Uncharacterized protein n=1 Tax=Rehmannia glutinosa TaxID=99300 RepID=A0ABR0WKD0_REHGL
MSPEPTKHDATLHDTDKQKTLDQEVRELISALTNRLGSIQRSQKPGGSTNQNQADDEDEQGVRIITLAGSNLGATMRGEMDEKSSVGPQDLALQPEQEDFAAYVNSNFQAINNSIMLGGSYKTNDPGVHLDISDYYEHTNGKNKGRKNKRRISSKSDHDQVEHSDKSSDSEKS